ncbi:Os01g0154300 [Oryza sativa Japonica Group]|uniref:Os01g0154300 protein n=1 Tax=Oryza sativa subsp. japonica TaxID=39947 RepID=A0A0P0UYP9_ORYSJ|nr:Os01g0154300 [Oryza sativa Japonica Group]
MGREEWSDLLQAIKEANLLLVLIVLAVDSLLLLAVVAGRRLRRAGLRRASRAIHCVSEFLTVLRAALEILLASLRTKTVLTDVFLLKKKVSCKREAAT